MNPRLKILSIIVTITLFLSLLSSAHASDDECKTPSSHGLVWEHQLQELKVPVANSATDCAMDFDKFYRMITHREKLSKKSEKERQKYSAPRTPLDFKAAITDTAERRQVWKYALGVMDNALTRMGTILGESEIFSPLKSQVKYDLVNDTLSKSAFKEKFLEMWIVFFMGIAELDSRTDPALRKVEVQFGTRSLRSNLTIFDKLQGPTKQTTLNFDYLKSAAGFSMVWAPAPNLAELHIMNVFDHIKKGLDSGYIPLPVLEDDNNGRDIDWFFRGQAIIDSYGLKFAPVTTNIGSHKSLVEREDHILRPKYFRNRTTVADHDLQHLVRFMLLVADAYLYSKSEHLQDRLKEAYSCLNSLYMGKSLTQDEILLLYYALHEDASPMASENHKTKAIQKIDFKRVYSDPLVFQEFKLEKALSRAGLSLRNILGKTPDEQKESCIAFAKLHYFRTKWASSKKKEASLLSSLKMDFFAPSSGDGFLATLYEKCWNRLTKEDFEAAIRPIQEALEKNHSGAPDEILGEGFIEGIASRIENLMNHPVGAKPILGRQKTFRDVLNKTNIRFDKAATSLQKKFDKDPVCKKAFSLEN